MSDRLSAEHLDLLDEIMQKVEADVGSFGELFYTRLFERHPELRSLFRRPLRQQAHHLVDSLACIAMSFHDGELSDGLLEALAAVHVGYGVQREHYSWIGENLAVCFRDMLGDAWTERHDEAWDRAYRLIEAGILRALDRMGEPRPGTPTDLEGG
jgi:nitric oxide dioxygenase